MSKQEIMEVILGCAEKLKHVPTFEELVQMTEISHKQIRKHFGGYTRALLECNLEPKEIGRGAYKLPLEKLFADWAGVVRKLKKLPTVSEYEMHSKYTSNPLQRRFGSWQQVPHGLKQFAGKFGLAEEWKAELELVPTPPAASAIVPVKTRFLLPDRRVYGAPMFPGPMAYASVNEMGVVFLFGWMAPQLGYVVHSLRPEFPDCEAMRRVGEDRCQLVKAEFEYESRNFLKHMHDVKGCDLIICWRHNWPECPLEVVELKKVLSLQQAAVSQNFLPQNLTTD
ncbi:MAG TPA: hypothetical protein VIK39_02390 [Candidatus Angelobacter sp.]